MDEGKVIRTKLFLNDLTQRWLMGELRKREINIDAAGLSAILRGARTGPHAERILKLSQEILKEEVG